MSLILAISFGLIAYSALNIGMVLEKKGASTLPQIENTSALDNLKNFLGCKVWVIGVSITSLQVIFLMIALTMAPLSLISPLFGFGLVVLAFFSKLYLNEDINKIEYAGIGVTILGIILLGLFSNPNEINYTVNEIASLFFAPFSLFFFLSIIIFTMIVCTYSILNNYKLAAIIFGFASGIAGAFGNIFMKGVSSGVGQFSLQSTIINFVWIIMLILSFTGSGFSMMLLQIGFQKGKAVLVAPIYSIIAMIYPTISGIIILGEWSGQLLLNILIQSVGIIIIVLGIIILSFYNELKKAKSEES